MAKKASPKARTPRQRKSDPDAMIRRFVAAHPGIVAEHRPQEITLYRMPGAVYPLARYRRMARGQYEIVFGGLNAAGQTEREWTAAFRQRTNDMLDAAGIHSQEMRDACLRLIDGWRYYLPYAEAKAKDLLFGCAESDTLNAAGLIADMRRAIDAAQRSASVAIRVFGAEQEQHLDALAKIIAKEQSTLSTEMLVLGAFAGPATIKSKRDRDLPLVTKKLLCDLSATLASDPATAGRHAAITRTIANALLIDTGVFNDPRVFNKKLRDWRKQLNTAFIDAIKHPKK